MLTYIIFFGYILGSFISFLQYPYDATAVHFLWPYFLCSAVLHTWLFEKKNTVSSVEGELRDKPLTQELLTWQCKLVGSLRKECGLTAKQRMWTIWLLLEKDLDLDPSFVDWVLNRICFLFGDKSRTALELERLSNYHTHELGPKNFTRTQSSYALHQEKITFEHFLEYVLEAVRCEKPELDLEKYRQKFYTLDDATKEFFLEEEMERLLLIKKDSHKTEDLDLVSKDTYKQSQEVVSPKMKEDTGSKKVEISSKAFKTHKRC